MLHSQSSLISIEFSVQAELLWRGGRRNTVPLAAQTIYIMQGTTGTCRTSQNCLTKTKFLLCFNLLSMQAVWFGSLRLCFLGAGDTCTASKVNKGLPHSCSLNVWLSLLTFLCMGQNAIALTLWSQPCTFMHMCKQSVGGSEGVYSHIWGLCRKSAAKINLSSTCLFGFR